MNLSKIHKMLESSRKKISVKEIYRYVRKYIIRHMFIDGLEF